MKSISRRVAVLAALCCLPQLARAEFRADFGAWRYDLSGQVTDGGNTYDFDRNLELKPSGRSSAHLAWETGPGAWPDWSASYAKFGATGHHVETFTVTNPPLPPVQQTVTIDATADLSDYDVAMSWPVHAGSLATGLGLAVKRLSGVVVIDDSSNPPPRHEHYSETFPELYLGLRLPLGSALALTGAAQGVSYGGNRAFEWRAGAELRLFTHLLLEAGYQVKRYKIDLDNYKLDARLSGALVRAGWVWG